MQNKSGSGAASSMFLGSANLLSNVVAGGAAYWGAPLLYEVSIAFARNHAAMYFPSMIRTYAGLIWAVGCGLLIFALTRLALSIFITKRAFASALKLSARHPSYRRR